MPFADRQLSSLLHRASDTDEQFQRVVERSNPVVNFADIAGNIRQAVKENTAMTETTPTITDTFLEGMKNNQQTVSDERARIVEEQSEAEKEFAAQIERLNDEIKARTDTHADQTADFETRLADADETLARINLALGTLPEPVLEPETAPTPAPETAPTPAPAVPTPAKDA